MNNDEFHQEKHYISKKYKCKFTSIKIEEHPTIGELCIYISGKWVGYIDNNFYEEMDE